ncbi:hypothetical protein [Sphaerisporangium album]|uniref:hypothetical protein n=1 Tax=Sphaerisporangium album TaxID=509200 RepID=UPI0015F0E479|nr:hypothetical protein [Sphaerisporangium album]
MDADSERPSFGDDAAADADSHLHEYRLIRVGVGAPGARRFGFAETWPTFA